MILLFFSLILGTGRTFARVFFSSSLDFVLEDSGVARVFLGGGGSGDKLLPGSRLFCKTAEFVAAVTSFVEVLRDLYSSYY